MNTHLFLSARRILKGLKKDCAGMNGNKDFWVELQKLGRHMSLISSTEAKRVGGISDVSESAADSVSVLFWLNFRHPLMVVSSLCNSE